MEKNKEKKKSRHSKTKQVSKEKKQRRLKNIVGAFFRKGKHYNKLKTASNNSLSSTDNVTNRLGDRGVVNESFLPDNVQDGENCFHVSVSAAESRSTDSPMSGVDECLWEVSAANSDDNLLQHGTPSYIAIPYSQYCRLQNINQEFSDEVARLREEIYQQKTQERKLLQIYVETAKGHLNEQYRREIQQNTLSYERKLQQQEKTIGQLNEENSLLNEVNSSLVNNCLMKEDEIRELQRKCLVKEEEITTLHQNMTILMQRYRKVKLEHTKKKYLNKMSIANAEYVNVVWQNEMADRYPE